MIIKIEGLPKDQQIKHINVDISFVDGEITEVRTNNDNKEVISTNLIEESITPLVPIPEPMPEPMPEPQPEPMPEPQPEPEELTRKPDASGMEMDEF